MRREVRTDKRTILSITEPTNECNARTKSCGSDEGRCNISSGLSLARLDAALIVRLEGVDVKQIID